MNIRYYSRVLSLSLAKMEEYILHIWNVYMYWIYVEYILNTQWKMKWNLSKFCIESITLCRLPFSLTKMVNTYKIYMDQRRHIHLTLRITFCWKFQIWHISSWSQRVYCARLMCLPILQCPFSRPPFTAWKSQRWLENGEISEYLE